MMITTTIHIIQVTGHHLDFLHRRYEVYLGLTTTGIKRLKGINPTDFKELWVMDIGIQWDVDTTRFVEIDCTWKFSENTSLHLLRRQTMWMDDSVDCAWLKLYEDNEYYMSDDEMKYIFVLNGFND